MIHGPACDHKDRAYRKKRFLHQLEVIGHRLGRPVRLKLVDRHVTEYRLANDFCYFLTARLGLQSNRVPKLIGNNRGCFRIVGADGPTRWCCDLDSPRSVVCRLNLVPRAEVEEPWEFLRARDSPGVEVAQCLGTIAKATSGADGQLASLLSEHGLDWIPPKFCNCPRGPLVHADYLEKRSDSTLAANRTQLGMPPRSQRHRFRCLLRMFRYYKQKN